MTQPLQRDVAVVTPWYPNRELPFRGAFVQAMVQATAPGCDRVTVLHCDAWWSRPGSPQEGIDQAGQALIARVQNICATSAGARMWYVPVPMPGGRTFAQIADRHEKALGVALGGEPIDAPVVHAHVGVPSGWAALHHLPPDARFFVTEHATFLDKILAEPDSREMYRRVLARCDGLFAVGDRMRDLFGTVFPEHLDKISVVPNPISFEEERLKPVTELRRWIYVGGLVPRKGVNWLLDAFAVCHAEDPTLTLTLVGQGELNHQLRSQVAELGLDDAVTFHGAVPPDEALRLMYEHDLLVHPSRMETFGVTVVEAIAAGMPVLVTRCGGPEETLAGIELAAGEFIPVEEGEEAIVDGYRRLRDRFPAGVDLAHARGTLSERFGFAAVRRAHHGAWFPHLTPVAAGAGRPVADQNEE